MNPPTNLSSKLYDKLKFVAQVLLPAVGTGYFGLAQIWHLPHPEEIVGTITVVDTFLGLLLSASTAKYNKTGAGAPDGDLIIQEVDGEKFPALGVNTSLESMQGKDTVKLNVVTQQAPPADS